jgi:transcriptional regulator with XRE-family HTH domain
MAVRAVQLDFLHPTGRGSRLGPLLLVVGAIVALSALSYQRHLAQEVVAREAHVSDMRGMASRSAPALSERESDTPEVREQIKKANIVLQQMNVPWSELFAAIESAEGSDIALLAVQPDPRSRTLLLGGEARNLPAVLGYMGRLERTKRLRDVVLVTHELRSKEPGQPVAFALNAAWVEAR